jgi:hypothetical protein
MSGLDKEDIIRMAREVADKDKVDPVHNDMVTLTVDELGKLLAAEREARAKEWVGLTDKDRWELVQKTPDFAETVTAVEAKLKEKNAT